MFVADCCPQRAGDKYSPPQIYPRPNPPPSSFFYAHGESIEEMQPQVNWDVEAILHSVTAYRLHVLRK